MYSETRPWGEFQVLYDASEHNYKVKRLLINPTHSISLQSHFHRKEHWVIISGNGTAIVGNDSFPVYPGDHVVVDREVIHRLTCTSLTPLLIIEIQTGEYLGEDDIVRLEDKYNRIK